MWTVFPLGHVRRAQPIGPLGRGDGKGGSEQTGTVGRRASMVSIFKYERTPHHADREQGSEGNKEIEFGGGALFY